jgi:hypothetical protein
MEGGTASFAIKAEVRDLDAQSYSFTAQKTMYGGRTIAAGDGIFLFASENEGGRSLFARGIVISSVAIAKPPQAGGLPGFRSWSSVAERP